MSRFILIDHALLDTTGHHFEYAQRVLNAARQAGYETVLAANRSFAATAEQPHRCYPVYRHGLWVHQGSPRLYGQVSGAAQRLKRMLRFSPRGRDAPAESLRGAARFREGRRGLGGAAHAVYDQLRSRAFYRDTLALLSKDVGKDDVVFAPSMSCVEMAALQRLFKVRPALSSARWHCLFRREPAPETRNASSRRKYSGPPLARTFQWAAGGGSASRVRLYTDSDDLTAQFQRLSGCEFQTLPIPATHCPSQPGAPLESAFRVICLGGARLEKGFHHLPDVIAQSVAHESGHPSVNFVVQTYCDAAAGPAVLSARESLRGAPVSGLTLLDKALGSVEYLGLLATADVALFPYDKTEYAARSSGVFAEALAAGIPVVVPAGTWMARQVPRHVGLGFENLGEIPSMIREILKHRTQYRNAAAAHANSWRQYHSASRLLEMLIGQRH